MSEQETNNQNLEQPESSLEQQLKECHAQKDEWKDRFLRTAADFENFKKRSEKERMLWMSTAQSAVLQDLLTIVDDFDRAFAQPADASNARAGFELIYKALQKMLEKYGVTEIKDASHFDPAKHEAIMQVEAANKQSGDIIQVLQKGYLFKGEVLRPAKVSVAK
jgi:molecular chaperone GrpE